MDMGDQIEIFPGVYQVVYRMPLRYKNGALRQPVEWKINGDMVKTLYDPAQVSDEQYLDWAREALSRPRLVPGCHSIYEGTARNGLKFRGVLQNEVFQIVYAVR